MTSSMAPRTGAQVLVDALMINATRRVFCVPGESYLGVLDALHDASIDLIVCRHEGSAAYMAEAHGKLTGRPGVCIVTRGPGAANSAVGVHTARQDSTPLLLFVGQVGRDVVEREAFQEVDLRQMFTPLAKWVVQIEDARRIPELVGRAYRTAMSGRPGPVVIALPEDMLRDVVDVTDIPPATRATAGPPSRKDIAALQDAVLAASRPVIIIGGPMWSETARKAVSRFAQDFQLPLAAAFRRQDIIDNRTSSYVGDLSFSPHGRLASALRDSDLVVAIGTRLGDITTGGYGLLQAPMPAASLIHVHEDVAELGRVYHPQIAINASIEAFASALGSISPPLRKSRWAAWTQGLRDGYLASLAPEPIGSAVNLGSIVRTLSRRLPDDAIIANGAGNYAAWVHRFYSYRGLHTQLAPTNGSMGYGVPAAIAAKLERPQSIVVCFSGDGCFLMNGQELATAVQYGTCVVFLVVNNGMYGTIRMHQERAYPRRVIGTSLYNPDFVALAKSYGLAAERVARTDDFMPAFERALQASGPALIEIVVDPEIISPKATISQIREEAEGNLAKKGR